MLSILLSLALCFHVPQQQDSLLVMFWNVENFFDYRSESRPQYWTKKRFYSKCNAISKVILRVAGKHGKYPDVIGFAEIENAYVMRQLVSSTPLRKLGYSLVHYESPDHRGIDCALLYRRNRLHLSSSEPKHLADSSGNPMATRDILLARFDSIAILVNHHPSQIGGKTEGRDIAMKRMKEVTDSLLSSGCRGVLTMGDFNQDYWKHGGSTGTIKYNGRWEKIDGHFPYGGIVTREEIFADPILLAEDKSYGGQKPIRTFSGPRYLGGISDHLPVVIVIKVL